MEKLQAALENARKTRAGKLRDAPVPRRSRQQGEDCDALDQRWQDLQTFEVADRALIKRRVVTRQASASATPFDILRTKVLLQMRQNGWKRLAITSPMPKSGKTTTACNLALGLGRQRDLRSMLLDLDLRDPAVHQFFQTRPPHTIGDVLRGDVDFSEQALRVGDNIAFSMAQSAEDDPTRLLLSNETADVLDRIEATYQPDIMIFDLPSVLVNDETRAFLKNVDCALIITRANTTRYNQLDVCEREVAEHTNVLGTVLNAYRYADNNTATD